MSTASDVTRGIFSSLASDHVLFLFVEQGKVSRAIDKPAKCIQTTNNLGSWLPFHTPESTPLASPSSGLYTPCRCRLAPTYCPFLPFSRRLSRSLFLAALNPLRTLKGPRKAAVSVNAGVSVLYMYIQYTASLSGSRW